MIDFNKLLKREKGHAFLTGKIHTYKEFIKYYECFMDDEFKELVLKKLEKVTRDRENTYKSPQPETNTPTCVATGEVPHIDFTKDMDEETLEEEINDV